MAYGEGDYAAHWLKIIGAATEQPIFAHVNWFQKDPPRAATTLPVARLPREPPRPALARPVQGRRGRPVARPRSASSRPRRSSTSTGSTMPAEDLAPDPRHRRRALAPGDGLPRGAPQAVRRPARGDLGGAPPRRPGARRRLEPRAPAGPRGDAGERRSAALPCRLIDGVRRRYQDISSSSATPLDCRSERVQDAPSAIAAQAARPSVMRETPCPRTPCRSAPPPRPRPGHGASMAVAFTGRWSRRAPRRARPRPSRAAAERQRSPVRRQAQDLRRRSLRRRAQGPRGVRTTAATGLRGDPRDRPRAVPRRLARPCGPTRAHLRRPSRARWPRSVGVNASAALHDRAQRLRRRAERRPGDQARRRQVACCCCRRTALRKQDTWQTPRSSSASTARPARGPSRSAAATRPATASSSVTSTPASGRRQVLQRHQAEHHAQRQVGHHHGRRGQHPHGEGRRQPVPRQVRGRPGLRHRQLQLQDHRRALLPRRLPRPDRPGRPSRLGVHLPA